VVLIGFRADLIIHEQTHATIFIKNEVQFNEELATFVGREGALAYLRDRCGMDSEAYREALASLQDRSAYRKRVIELYHRLERIYNRTTDRETILGQKLRVVEQFNRRLCSEAKEFFHTDRFRSFPGIPANNAYIMSFVRYSLDLELFYRLYETKQRDLKATVEALKQLNQADESPKAYLERLIAE
jgi:predicted aminopeptidase